LLKQGRGGGNPKSGMSHYPQGRGRGSPKLRVQGVRGRSPRPSLPYGNSTFTLKNRWPEFVGHTHAESDKFALIDYLHLTYNA